MSLDTLRLLIFMCNEILVCYFFRPVLLIAFLTS